MAGVLEGRLGGVAAGGDVALDDAVGEFSRQIVDIDFGGRGEIGGNGEMRDEVRVRARARVRVGEGGVEEGVEGEEGEGSGKSGFKEGFAGHFGELEGGGVWRVKREGERDVVRGFL